MSVVRLDGELTIPRAADLHPLLEQAAAQADAAGVELDLGAVAECDSAGVQVLLAARRTLAARGAALRLTACSAAAQAVFSLYGIADAFGAAATD
jgi:anti-anti-sigma factor